MGYVTGSAISLVAFARTRNFAFLRTAQLLLILVAPALGTVLLGGLRESSAVILRALFAPLGAVVFDRPGRAWAWFAAFVATILLALVFSEVVRPDGADLPEGFVRTFDVLNIVVVSFVAMLLLVSFARGRAAAQARVEALLLNVLPADVAQRLQSDPNSIADSFDEVSILFADVVDFTPLAGRARRTRGRRAPRSPLHELRRARRPLRGREDQDDRRLLHGRGGRPHAAPGPCASAGKACDRDARVCETVPPRQPQPQPAPAHRDQLGSGGGGCDRASSLPLRPVGGHREHGESHGVARDTERDPDHPLDVGAPGQRLRDGADRARRREGKGRNRDVADRGPAGSRACPFPDGADPDVRSTPPAGFEPAAARLA